MELVETTLSQVERRAGAVRVLWSDLAAQQRRRGEPVRVLAPGDDVMLQVDGDIVHRGRVLRYVGSGADGAYVILFGAAVTRRDPLRRTEPVPARVIPLQRNRRVSGHH
jgi:hypothetical protein